MTFPLDQILNILDKECQGGIFRRIFRWRNLEISEKSRNP